MRKKHVLLIDDNEIDNYVTNHIINRSEIADKTTIKNSAVAALEYLETIKGNTDEFPDMIFLDIRMPTMDGFGFLDELTKFPEANHNQCSVVMLSSSSDQKDIDQAFQYPVVKKFLTKPLLIDKLENL